MLKITINKVDRNESHLNAIDVQIERLQKKSDEMMHRINAMKEEKLEISKFEVEKELITNEIDK